MDFQLLKLLFVVALLNREFRKNRFAIVYFAAIKIRNIQNKVVLLF